MRLRLVLAFSVVLGALVAGPAVAAAADTGAKKGDSVSNDSLRRAATNILRSSGGISA